MISRIFGRSAPKWRAHVNPDGSRGGMVSTSATIEEGAYIPVSAVVLPGVYVPQNAQIVDGSLITTDGSVQFSPPKISL